MLLTNETREKGKLTQIKRTSKMPFLEGKKN